MEKIRKIVDFLLKLKKGEDYYLESPDEVLNYSIVSQKIFALTILNNTIFSSFKSFNSQKEGEDTLLKYLQKNEELKRFFNEASVRSLKFFLWNSYRKQ